VHAVLSTQVPTQQTDADVRAAVERTDQIGQQLADTAEALEKTTEKLRELVADSDNTAG
jgi:ABC-type transporter Mla subunit MlaD